MEKTNEGTQSLDSRVALVTEGGHGIDSAGAMVQRGARVAITNINHDLVEETAMRLSARTMASYITDSTLDVNGGF